jgi:uncharacterized protein (DUF58 family)
LLIETVVFLVILLVVGAFVKGGFVLTVLYLLLGVYIISLVWIRQSAKNISCEREFEKRVFLGEDVPIHLKIQNAGRLPIPWLYVYESLPSELSAGHSLKRVVHLGSRGKLDIPYTLTAYKRGYYPIGPLVIKFGDIIGLAETQELDKAPDYITVFPRMVSISNLKLPSRSPLGTLRYHQPIFEDPSRMRGKRDYVASDSLRRVDWKATASTGRLQVKQYEPSIALQTAIFLNLNTAEYPTRRYIDATELAIVIAASMANWIVSQKQSVGLITNGVDPHSVVRNVQPLAPRKGRGQLVHILDLLARLQATDQTSPLKKILNDEASNLAWGTTVIVITGQVNEALFDELFQLKRRGQNVVLVVAGHAFNIQKVRQQAKQASIPLYAFANEKSLDVWRRK